MSYTNTRRRRRHPALQAPLGGVTDIISAGVNIATDPCLSEVTGLALQLHELEQSATPGGPATPGVGLCGAVTPLRVVVWVRQNPWSAVAVSVALIGSLIGIGYSMAGGNRTA
jgi:hypothetical protein